LSGLAPLLLYLWRATPVRLVSSFFCSPFPTPFLYLVLMTSSFSNSPRSFSRPPVHLTPLAIHHMAVFRPEPFDRFFFFNRHFVDLEPSAHVVVGCFFLFPAFMRGALQFYCPRTRIFFFPYPWFWAPPTSFAVVFFVSCEGYSVGPAFT